MKLAEALIERADAQQRLVQIEARLVRNARVQEGDLPAENPKGLLEEYERTAASLLSMIQRINRTNTSTPIDLEAFAPGSPPTTSLSDAITLRDHLKARHTTYRNLAHHATISYDRMTRTEIKFQSTVDVPAMQQKADQYARAGRELDARIQELNWKTDLMD